MPLSTAYNIGTSGARAGIGYFTNINATTITGSGSGITGLVIGQIGGSFGAQNSGTAATPGYFTPYGNYNDNNAGGGAASAPITTSCTLTNLHVSLQYGAASTTYTWTLYKNGTATPLTCSVTGGPSVSFRPASDTTHSVSITAGDVISLQATNASGNQQNHYGGWAVQMVK